MPAPLAVPLGLAAGSSLAWLAAAAPPGALAGSAIRARTAARYFGVLVLAPAAGLLELVAPPWASFYVADLPSAVSLILCVLAGAAPIAGERIAQARLERGDARGPLALALGGVLVTLLGGALAWDRMQVVATQTAFERGIGGAELFGDRAGAALVAALVAILSGYALAVRALAGPQPVRGPERAGRGARTSRLAGTSAASRS